MALARGILWARLYLARCVSWLIHDWGAEGAAELTAKPRARLQFYLPHQLLGVKLTLGGQRDGQWERPTSTSSSRQTLPYNVIFFW